MYEFSRIRSRPSAGIVVVPLLLLLALGGCATGPQTQEDSREWSFWPQTSEPRIQYLTSFSGSRELAATHDAFRDFVLGKETEADFDLNKPYGVAIWHNCIYVTDTRNNCVVIFDLIKREVRLMGSSGSGKLLKPVSIAIASDGIKYVADTGHNGIYIYNDKDQFVTDYNAEGFRPVAVATYRDELYAAELHMSRIQVLNRFSGQVIRTLPIPANTDGHGSGPLGLTVDASGYLYLTDVLNCRIVKLSPQGKSLLAFGKMGDSPGTFARPKHIAVDKSGIIYVVDSAFQNVQVFNQQGQILISFGFTGPQQGAMELPAGICTTEEGVELFQKYIHPSFKADRLIIVTNQFGPNKVSIYALGQRKEGMRISHAAMKSAPTTTVAGESIPSLPAIQSTTRPLPPDLRR